MASTSTGSDQLVKEDEDEVIMAGTTLLACEPFVYSGYRSSPDLHFCDTCLIIADEKGALVRCMSCRMVWYCSETCQEKGWNDGHKYECKAMKLHSQTLEATPRESICEARILLRIFVKLQDEETDHFDELEIGGTKVKRRFSDLMSHSEELRQNMEKVTFVRGLVKLFLGHKSKIRIPADQEFIEIYGKVITNALEIGDGLYTVGSGVYLARSILNHSCDPMAELVFDGTTLYVRNILEIPKSLPIDKVTMCYTIPLVPSQERKRLLNKRYHFNCECERCKTGQFDKEMRSIICSGKDCNAKIDTDTEEMKGPCSACGHVMKKKVISDVLSTQKFVCELLDRGNLDLPRIEGCIKKMKAINFSDMHWVMVKLFHDAFYKAAGINVNTGKALDGEKAFEYGSKYFLAVKHYVHPYDKELLRSCYEMSRTALGLGKFDEAEKCLSEAKAIAEVLHGKDSPFIRKRIASVEEGITKAKAREMKNLPVA